MQVSIHTQIRLKKMNLLSISDIHNTKILCLYKNLIDKRAPQNIQKIFSDVLSNQTQKAPRTQHFQLSPRCELPEYISTAPPELLARIYEEKYLLFKKHMKEYFIESYSSLCTQIGCASCHLHIKIN